MANEVINTVIDKKAFKQLDDLVLGLQKANGEFLTLAESSAKVGKNAFNVKGIKSYNNQIKESSRYITDANAANKEAERINNNLTRQKAKLNSALSEENKKLIALRFANQQANKTVKEAAVLSSRHSTAMQKLTTQRNLAKRGLQDYAAKQALGIKITKKEEREIKQLRHEYKRLDAAYRKSNRTVGEYFDNVGNYQSGMKKFTGLVRGLVGAFGLIEGARIGLNFAKESIDLARQAKSVEFAFDRLGQRGVSAFENIKTSTRGLLSDLDIKKSINEFENFNISLEESDTLFEFLAVRAAQTGQSVDKLKDSLVEGLSKESKLRIDNLGISASELNKELEQTPDFVQAVANIAKREIKEAGNILDETASQSEKWNASLINLKISFGKLLNNNSLGGLGFLSKMINNISEGLDTLNLGIKVAVRGFGDFLRSVGISTEKLSAFIGQLKFLSGFEVIGRIFRIGGASLSGFAAVLQAVTLEFKKFINVFSVLDFSNPLAFFNSIKNIKFDFDFGNIATSFKKGFADAFLSSQELADDFADSISSSTDSAGKSISETIKGTINDLEGLKKIQQDLRDSTATTSSQYKEFTDNIQELNRQIDVLKNGLSTLKTEGIEELFPEDDDISDSLDKLREDVEESKRLQDKKRKDAEEAQLKTEQAITSSFNRIGALYGVDLTAFSNLLTKKMLSAEDYAEGVGDILSLATNVLTQGTIDGINAEINALDRKYNFILDNENLTADERERIENEREIKRKQLERRRLEAEKQQAIFSSLVNTSVAIVKTFATLGFPAGIPAAAAIGALGAIETAIIASRPIPEFKDGKNKSNKYEGMAVVGDGGRHEVKYSKDGKVSLTPNVPTLDYVKSDDIIFPSIKDFYKSDVFNPSIASHIKVGDNTGYDVKAIADEIISANRQSLGKARFVNNTIVKSESINHSLWKMQNINV